MRISTSRFGFLEIASADVIEFPAGLPGLEDCKQWVLLADADNDALGWLQCTTRAEVALAVVSPRRFVPDYRLRVGRDELGSEWEACVDELHVLAIVGKDEQSVTLNLKAPLVIHLPSRRGRQVIAGGNEPVQYELRRESSQRRKVA